MCFSARLLRLVWVSTTTHAFMNTKKTGNSLRLRWWYEGKRYSLSLQLKDTAIHRAYANEIAARIDKDMQAGYFDRKRYALTTGLHDSEFNRSPRKRSLG